MTREGSYVWVGAVWLAPGKDGSANVDELVWLVTYVLMVSRWAGRQSR